MKKLTLVVLLFFPLLASPAAPEAPAQAKATQLEILRERLVEAKQRDQWEAVAFELLTELDRRGESREAEATWLVSHLLETHPDDPTLLWRRATSERLSGDNETAIADLERLVEISPKHSLGVRARRALPALYLAVGLTRKSAEADEALLRDGLADAVGVLSRLSRTYALIGQKKKVLDTLQRLRKLAPERLTFDANALWLAAEAAREVGGKREGLALLLRFSNLFPNDPRRPWALLHAAGIYRDLGNDELALHMVEEAVDAAKEPGVAVEGRLQEGLVLEAMERVDEARENYKAVIEAALEPAPAAKALERLIAIEKKARGVEGALLMLASMIRDGDPFVREMARNSFDGLMRELNPQLAKDPARAAFYFELARGVSQLRALSPAAQIAAARLYEDVGSYEHAGAIYKSLVKSFGPPNPAAIEGLARTLPEEKVEGYDPLDPQRLAALERKERWQAILHILSASHFEGKGGPERRRLAARAQWSEGQPDKARELLESLSGPQAEAALLRGDARALAGQWQPACEDYRAAHRAYSHGPELAWLDVRLAACELRAGQIAAAKKRLEALLARTPLMPASFAAEDLLTRVASSSS